MIILGGMNDSEEKYLVFGSGEKMTAIHEAGYQRPENHQYVIFSDQTKNGLITEIGFQIINFYLPGIKQERKKWKLDKRLYQVDYPNNKTGVTHRSKLFNYLTIAAHLRQKHEFISTEFNLPEIALSWMDSSAEISINFHKFDGTSAEALSVADGTPKEQYGERYPIHPKLDREGHFFSTLQPQLLKRVVRQRTDLISNSANALHPDWVLDLRSLINDTVSLLEITLNQFYIKAEYDPQPGWKFDKTFVGEKHGRRLNDKLKWVYQITGRQLNIESERKSLDNLREVRNHFNHFDPPSLVITLEEATEWINQVIDIAMILMKIRIALGGHVSVPLIHLLLQKLAIFNPEPAFSARLPLDSIKSGYHSSTWNSND